MKRALSILMMLAAVAGVSAAGASAFYKELNLLVGYSQEEEWIGEKGMLLKNAAGFEVLREFSNDYGDYLTLDVQARAGYDTRDDVDERWALELHNAWLDYKLGLGRNLRLGHFDPAFGLEPSVDTHGTLFQTLAAQDIGFKKDWGVGFRSGLGPFDYELAGQIGSGMGIARKDGSFLASGRIGSPAGREFQYGVSALHGEVLRSLQARTIPEPDYADGAIRKTRVGLDAQYLSGPWLFRGETTVGQNETNDVFGALVQADYTIPALQALTLKAQGRYWTDDPDDSRRESSSFGLGASYAINQDVTIRFAVFHDIEKPEDDEDTQAFLQIYYYGR